MRLMSRAAMVAAALLVPAVTLAQVSLGVAGGLTMPTGDATNSVKSGYNLTVALGIKPPVAPIGFRVDAMWNSLDAKATGADPLRVLGGTANLTVSGPMLPMGYLIGGAGMYNFSSSGSSNSNTELGFNVGAGLNIPLTGFSTFLEARYHHVNAEQGSFQFIPITFGLRF